MTHDDFTLKAQQIILAAQKIALSLNQKMVDTAHLMRAILEADEKLFEWIFSKSALKTAAIKKELNKLIEKTPRDLSNGIEKQYLTSASNKALSLAKKSLIEFNDKYISPELIILGVVSGTDELAKFFKNSGVTQKVVKDAIVEYRKGQKVTVQNDELFGALEKYTINLTQRAIDGELDPIVGRDDEIRRILHILSRRKKNNPILVGDSGVGKTAIVEGIAWRIIKKDVPENLLDKNIHVLDLAAMVAGAKYKGEFEERLKALMNELKDSNGKVILFIDEIHTLIGAGGGNGSMDAANILKPALARGDLLVIGATTPEEFQKYFEKDQALVRRFQRVNIEETSVEETISILRGIQEKYENFHRVDIIDEALIAAAELAYRYIPDRRLPDKAIDLLDEAASKRRMELDSVPEKVDELRRKVAQLEIDREFLKRENSTKRLQLLEENIKSVKKELEEVEAEWNREKELVATIHDLKTEIEDLKHKKNIATSEGKFEEAAEIEYLLTKEKLVEFKKLNGELKQISAINRFTKEDVTAEDVALAVSKWTGIPVQKMQQNERKRLLNLENEIGKRLIGQREAVEAVCDAVRRNRAGLQDSAKPIGSFLFLGPTGVGKTELAKALAEVLFDDENAINRIDMSEYQEKHSVSRLIGPPPGYVGYEEGGQLTEAVRRRAYSLVLLDEIEKAHPDTFNILLQVLDDGRLTDGKGRVVNFKNTIIIMTSNMGAETILENFEDLDVLGEQHRKDVIDTTKEEMIKILKENLRPEFLNRIDNKIVFLPLTRDEIKQIAGLSLKKLAKNLQRQGLDIRFSEAVLNLLVDQGYDPQFGARPLKRVIETLVTNPLSKAIIAEKFNEGNTIYAYVNKLGKIDFSDHPVDDHQQEESPVQDTTEEHRVRNRRSRRRKEAFDELQLATKGLDDAVNDIKGDQNNTE